MPHATASARRPTLPMAQLPRRLGADVSDGQANAKPEREAGSETAKAIKGWSRRVVKAKKKLDSTMDHTALGRRWRHQQEVMLHPFERMQLLSEIHSERDPDASPPHTPTTDASPPLLQHECSLEEAEAARAIQRVVRALMIRALIRANDHRGARLLAVAFFATEAADAGPLLRPERGEAVAHGDGDGDGDGRPGRTQEQQKQQVTNSSKLPPSPYKLVQPSSSHDLAKVEARQRRRLGCSSHGCLAQMASGCLDFLCEFALDLITDYNVTQPYLVLFATRRARALCTQCSTVLAPTQLPIRAEEAPPAVDMIWSNLFMPQARKRVWSMFGMSCTLVFFMLWHIPVAYAQRAPLAAFRAACSNETFTALEPYLGTGSSADGLVGSLTLKLLLAVSLNSGILEFLTQLRGASNYTAVYVTTLWHLWAFNFFMVLLGSCIEGSLYDTLLHDFINGWCAVARRLATDFPRRSSFFLSYVVSDLLVMLPGYDMLQIAALLLLPLRRFCCVDFAAIFQRRWHAYMYTRAQLIINVGMLFCCVAPIVVPFVAAWLAFALGVYLHNFKHVLSVPQDHGRAAGTEPFDSGGQYWPVAIRTQVCPHPRPRFPPTRPPTQTFPFPFLPHPARKLKRIGERLLQVYSLLMAQLVLAALLAINAAWWGTGCLLLLIPITYTRAQSIAAHFEPLAAGFSLQQCAELDAEQWQRAKKRRGSTSTKSQHGMPAELEELLRNGCNEYDGKARGQGPAMRGREKPLRPLQQSEV